MSFAIRHWLYLRLSGISFKTGKHAEYVSIFDFVTCIDTRGEGKRRICGLKFKTWYVLLLRCVMLFNSQTNAILKTMFFHLSINF